MICFQGDVKGALGIVVHSRTLEKTQEPLEKAVWKASEKKREHLGSINPDTLGIWQSRTEKGGAGE